MSREIHRDTSDASDASDLSNTEMNRVQTDHLINDLVKSFSWHNLEVLVKDRNTGQPRSILSNVQGIVEAGEMLAIMGPSGSGKTTLLNALAFRQAAAGADTTGEIMANGFAMDLKMIRRFSSYVEQEDALIGSLTVRETMKFAAGLSLPRYVNVLCTYIPSNTSVVRSRGRSACSVSMI